MKKRLKEKFTITYVFILIILIVYAVSMLYMILWGAMTSFKLQDEFRKNILGFPTNFTFENYALVWKWFFVETSTPAGLPITIYIEEMIINSIIYVGESCLAATVVPCLVAYLCANFNFKLSKIIVAIVIIQMALPIVGAAPSELQIIHNLGLYDNYLVALVLKASFLGMYFLVFYSTFQGIPKDYREAASIDGASEMRIMLNVYFPLIRNTFFTVMLLQGVAFWNDYQTPLLYMPTKVTVSYGLYMLGGPKSTEMSYTPPKMAGNMLLTLPISLIFIAFRNKMMGNLSVGGIKG